MESLQKIELFGKNKINNKNKTQTHLKMNFTSRQYSKYNSSERRTDERRTDERRTDERRTDERRTDERRTDNRDYRYNDRPKPFCPVCKKNGRPESEYNSHFIRETSDETSPITCPILLNMECNHCGEKGHIVAKCPHKKCAFCNEFGHTVSRCTAGTREEIDRFLDDRHNEYVNRQRERHLPGQRSEQRFDQRSDQRSEQRSEQRFMDQRSEQRFDQRPVERKPSVFDPKPPEPIPEIKEEDFPSLSKKPVKVVATTTKGFANIATLAIPLEAPKPVLKPVVKQVEEEYDSDDDDVEDNESIYSSEIPDDDNW
jgi:hypothetical protein